MEGKSDILYINYKQSYNKFVYEFDYLSKVINIPNTVIPKQSLEYEHYYLINFSIRNNLALINLFYAIKKYYDSNIVEEDKLKDMMLNFNFLLEAHSEHIKIVKKKIIDILNLRHNIKPLLKKIYKLKSLYLKLKITQKNYLDDKLTTISNYWFTIINNFSEVIDLEIHKTVLDKNKKVTSKSRRPQSLKEIENKINKDNRMLISISKAYTKMEKVLIDNPKYIKNCIHEIDKQIYKLNKPSKNNISRKFGIF